jgi:hypothetical protein
VTPREALAVLHADARDPNRDPMWRYGVQHSLTIVERAQADPERLWAAVVYHVGKVPAHVHDNDMTCGESILLGLFVGETDQ